MSVLSRSSSRIRNPWLLGGALLALLAASGSCSSPSAEQFATQGEPSGDGDEDAGIGAIADADTSDSGVSRTCGNLHAPCCSDSSCSTGLVCESGQCVLKGEGQLGTACTKTSDCESGICLELSNGKSVCTSTCEPGQECLAGWTCDSLPGRRIHACQCEPKAEACNALDDDCNGIIDDSVSCKQACDSPDECALATGISITDIVAYQAVGVPLMQNGADVFQSTAPIVVGKDTMFRVHVRPESGWKARELVAWVELHGGPGQVAMYSSPLHVTRASDEKELGTTFNIEIPGARLTGNIAYKVSLREKSPYSPTSPGTAAAALWPREGVAQLHTESSRGNFKFTIVPYRYNGRLPDTSEQQLRLFHDKFTSYPTPNVEITIHSPIDHSGTFDARGAGWTQLLNRTCNLRRNEGAPSNHYYYGIISPAASVAEFCGGGCVAGLAYLAEQPNDNFTRCGIGLGFTGAMAVETALHELGHALGRAHAPCGGPDSVDSQYPHPNGIIGVRGYDPARKLLREPSVRDFMGYCSPMWISDYTFRALFERIAFVNAMPRVVLPPDFPREWRSIVVEVDGSLHLAETTKLDTPPGGIPEEVYLLDANRKPIGTTKGFLYETHHLPGGSLLIPERELAGAKAIRLANGQELSL